MGKEVAGKLEKIFAEFYDPLREIIKTGGKKYGNNIDSLEG